MFYIIGKFSKLYVAKDSAKEGSFKLVSSKKKAMVFPTEEEAQQFFILNRAASFLIVPKNEG